MKNVLYIHGYNSNSKSRTSDVLKSELGAGYKVYHPTYYYDIVDPDEMLSIIKNDVNRYKIDIVIASSLGGFFAMKLKNIFKIVINPCMNPYEQHIINNSDSYNVISKTIWNNIDSEERALTYGVFSTSDELFSYYNDYCKHYSNSYRINDGHRISPMNIKNTVVLLVHKIFNEDIIKLQEQLNYNPTMLHTLNEHYVNAFSKDDMKQYAPEVWNILQLSYEYCGGLIGMNNAQQLIDESDMWKLVRLGGKIVCVNIYSTKRGGRKAIYGGTDGTREGIDAYYKMFKEDINLKDRNVWFEVSGKMERIQVKNGAIPIPATIAQKIMYDKEFTSFNPDGFHYTRKIGGIEVEKIMFGNIVIK